MHIIKIGTHLAIVSPLTPALTTNNKSYSNTLSRNNVKYSLSNVNDK